MHKFWRVSAYEYQRHVLRSRFLFVLLSVPGLILVMAVVGLLISQAHQSDRPLGYVDHSGLLASPLPAPELDSSNRRVPLLPFQTEAEAQTALQSKEIQAYYVLPQDYRQTGHADLVFIESPSSDAEQEFADFLRVNLMSGQPEPVAQRLIRGDNLTVSTPDGSRSMSQNDWFNIFTPFVTGLAFIIAIFTTSGYLLQAVVEEKENRTIEILLTSVSFFQMMGGKIIGIIGVGLTQIIVWISVAVIGVLIGRNYFELLRAVHISPGFIGLMLAVMLPSFVLIAALMAAVGATVTEAREGQQVTGLFTLPVMIPYWFSFQIMSNPNGPLAVALSYFPLTAPVAVTMRAGFTYLAPGEILLSVGILSLSALGALWLAGRALRLGLLSYGQRVNLRELVGRSK
ncbi:MAG TPA: ABC transporter permease [Anaerolineales bacterium]|nr:ABC transporter permease [Anaerolineales bacterium]